MSANDVIAEEQIPEWMKQAQRNFDWGAIIIVGFCLIASWAFISQSQLPAYNDTEHYVYQIADYAQAFEEGIAYNRWSPYAVFGYGAPIPHYYPSGTAYIGGLITYLITNDPLMSTRILFISSIILAGSMTYHFVKQHASALAGMIASLIYIFSPFVMLNVPHIEGDLAFSIGIGLLPSILWAVSRFLKRNQAFDFALLAMIIAITIFTVPGILAQSLIASMILIAVHSRRNFKRVILASLVGAILTGFLLASFFLLPAFAQYYDIEWYSALIEAPRYQLTLEQLFVSSQPMDSALMIPRPTYNLGWGLLFTLPISLIALIINKEQRLFFVSYLGLGIITLLIIVMLFPRQTSWFALITLCFAIASSYHGQSTAPKSLQLLGVWLSILVILVTSMPTWIIPHPELTIAGTSGRNQIQYQQSGYGYAGLPSGLALPSNLSPTDAEAMSLDNLNDEDSRFLTNVGTGITLLEESAYRGRYNINTNTPLTIEYSRAYFNNWQALSIMGDLSISESENNLMALNVPSNTETLVTLRIGLTFIIAIAWIMSLVALIVCGFLWWYRWRTNDTDYDTSILLTNRSSQIFILILILFSIIRFFAPSIPTHFLSRQPQYSMAESLFVQTNFDSNFQLLAYDIAQRPFRSGQNIQVRVYWTLNSNVNSHYLVQLRLTDNSRQETFYESGYTHAGYYPSSRWQAMSIVPQDFIFRLPASQGDYFITFDVYECNSACSIDIMDSNEAQGQIPVLRPVIVE